MPAMHYRLRWPDQSESECYSPSLVIKDFFKVGASYSLPEFLTSVRSATEIASERVRAKYGFACSAANGQLQEIEKQAESFTGQPEARVEVLSFDESV
jgi:uncharacterized repeat protein (TIGR04042 family)